MEQLNEFGFYTLAGHSDTPRDVVEEVRQAERIGLGSVFVSERFNTKEAATLCGAAAGVSETLGIATGATNHNTRHPLVTATFATTMHRMTGGRFALGLGRGFDPLMNAIGLKPITMAQLEDMAGILRRLWKGEMLLGHDGPAGAYPYLHQDADFDEDIPLMMVALGERTLEFAGRVFDGVILHTYFNDHAMGTSVAAVRRGAEQAGKDPDGVRIWSVRATIGNHIHDDLKLKKTVGRLATYLQGYGDLLVHVNGWDPAVLERFRADEFVRHFKGGLDAKATTAELEHVATLLPDEWLQAAAVGTPEQVTKDLLHQFDLGANGIILHGATPAELEPILPAYRASRPERFAKTPANPGRPIR